MAGPSKLRLGVELDKGIADNIAKQISDSTSEQLSKGIQQGIKDADVGSALGKVDFGELTKGLTDALSKAFSGADFGGFKADWIKNISDAIGGIDTSKLNSLIESFEKIKVAVGDSSAEHNLSEVLGLNASSIGNIEHTISALGQSVSKLEGIFGTLRDSGRDAIKSIFSDIEQQPSGLAAINTIIDRMTELNASIAALRGVSSDGNALFDASSAQSSVGQFTQLLDVLSKIKEQIETVNESMIRLMAGVGIGNVESHKSLDVLIDELTKIGELVNSLNSKDFTITNFFKNTVDDSQQFERRLQLFKELAGVIRQVQEAYANMNPYARDAVLAAGESKTVMDMMRYSPRNADSLNRTSVVAGITSMTDMIDTSLPIIEKYNAAIAELGHGRIPELQMPDLSGVQRAREELDGLTNAATALRDGASGALSSTNSQVQSTTNAVATASSTMQNAAQTEQESILALNAACTDIIASFSTLGESIKNALNFDSISAGINGLIDSFSNLASSIDSIINRYTGLTNVSQTAGDSANAVKQYASEVDAAYKERDAQIKQEQAEEAARTKAFERIEAEAAKAAAAEERAAQRSIDAWKKADDAAINAADKRSQALEKEVGDFRKSLQKKLNSNEMLSQSDQGEKLQKIIEELDSGNVNPQRLAELRAEAASLTAAFDSANSSASGFFGTLTSGIRNMAQFMIMRQMFMRFVQAIKKMASAIKEVDMAMTELRKVTDLTAAGYNQFYQNAVESAGKVGASVSDTINATADFARLGYNVDESLKLAEAALTYKNVGDGIDSVSQATESLISTIKAFGMEANDAMSVIDEFNEVGNRFAISSTGIGEALVRSASALHGAGNSLEESIGLITASNAIIQNPESVGTALKTLTMYLRAAKPDLEAMGEDTDDCANSVAELRDKLISLTGVDIMLDDNQFKSTYRIIQEISAVWGNLADVDRAAVTKLIGGKRNANVVQALLTNFSDAEKVVEAASNAAGSAARENEEYLDSIAGKIDVLKGKFQAMSEAWLGSGLVKMGINIVSVLTDIVKLIGGIPDTVKMILLSVTALAEFDAFFKGLPNVLSKAFDALKNIGSAGGLKNLIKSHPVITILAAVATAIVGITEAVQRHKQSLQEAIQDANDSAEAFSDSTKSYGENLKTLDELQKRYDELKGGVSEQGKNVSLTASEYSEFQSILQQIVDIAPSIVTGYNEEEAAMTDYANAISNAKDRLKELHDEETQGYLGGSADRWKAWRTDRNEKGRRLVESAGNDISAVFNTIGYDLYYDLLGGDSEYTNFPAPSAEFVRRYSTQVILPALKEAQVVTEDGVAEIESALLELGDLVSVYDVFKLLGPEEYALLAERAEQFANAMSFALVKGEEGKPILDIEQYRAIVESSRAHADELKKWMEPQINARNEILIWLEQEMSKDENRASPKGVPWYSSFIDMVDQSFDIGDKEEDWIATSEKIKQLYTDTYDIINGEGEDANGHVKTLNGLQQAYDNGNIAFQKYKEDYEAELAAWHQELQGPEPDLEESAARASEIAIGYFEGVVASADEAVNHVADSERVISKVFSQTSDAIEAYQTAKDLGEKARKEMRKNGEISATTMKQIIKSLPEDVNLTDYFTSEDGRLQVKLDAYDQFAESLFDIPVKEIDKQISDLQRAHANAIDLTRGFIDGFGEIEGGAEGKDQSYSFLRDAIIEHFGLDEKEANEMGYLIDRQIKTGEEMLKQGWKEFEGFENESVTYYSQAASAGDGREIPFNENVVFTFTPIDKDGNELSESDMWEYINGLFGSGKSMEDVWASDHGDGGKGLVLHYEIIPELEDGGELTGEALDAAFNEFEAKESAWGQRLHHLSAAYMQKAGGQTLTDYLNSEITKATEDTGYAEEAVQNIFTALMVEAKKVRERDPENTWAGWLLSQDADIENIIENEGAVGAIEELQSLMDFIMQVASMPDVDDPFGLKTMFEDIDQTKSDASDLVSALEEIKNGTVTNMADLAAKHPDLMTSVKDLIGIEDLGKAETVLKEELGKYETEYKAIVQGYIDSVGQMIAEAEPGEDTTQLRTLKGNLESLLKLDFSNLVTGANDFSKLNDAMSKASNYADLMRDAYDGIDFDFISKMMSTFGADWWKYMKTDAEGNFFGIYDNAIYNLISAELDLEGENAHLKASFDAMWEAAKKGDEATSQFDKLTDSISKAESIASLLADAQNLNGKPIDSLMQQVQSIFGDKWMDYFEWDELGNITGFLADKALAYVDEAFTSAEAPQAVRGWWTRYLADIMAGVDPSQSALQKLSTAISDVYDAQSLLTSASAPGARIIDSLDQIISFAEKNKIDIGELITFDQGEMKLNQDRVGQYIKEMTDPVSLMLKYGLTIDQAISISVQVRGAIEAEAELENLSNTISQVSSAADLLASVRAGDGDFVSMFQTVMQMANATGQDLSEFFTIIGDRDVWNEDAIIAWADAYVDGLDTIKGATPEMIAYLKQSIRETIEADTAYNAASNGVNNVANALKSSVSELGLSNEEMRQLTARYSKLEGFEPDRLFERTGLGIHISTEALKEYESAFQKQERELRQSKLEDLTDQYKALSDQIKHASDVGELAQLVSDRNNVAKQIDQLRILQSQYDALISKYNQWKQAQSGGEESDMYDDVTGNLEEFKELYESGKLGANKFKSFLELALGESADGKSNAELTEMYERAYPMMERYFTEGSEGATRMLEDLERLGHIQKNADGSWEAESLDINKAAEDLGMSADLLEIALRNLETYNFKIDWSGYESDVDDFATDIDGAIENIQKRKEELDESFANGDISDFEYADAMTRLDEYLKKLEKIRADKEGLTGEEEPLSLEEAKSQIEELNTLITGMAEEGLNLPVTLTGDIDTLNTLLDALGGGGQTEGDAGGGLSFTVDTPEDAAQRISDIASAMSAVAQASTVSPKLKTTLTLLGNMTVAQLAEIAAMDFPENQGYEIAISAADNATDVINAVDAKAAEGGPTYNVTVTPVDLGVQDSLDSFENDPHDANVNVTDGGTSEGVQNILNGIIDGEYPANVDVTGGEGVDAIEEGLAGLDTDHSAPVSVDDNGTIESTEQELDDTLGTEHPAPVNADDNDSIETVEQELDALDTEHPAPVGFVPDQQSLDAVFIKKQEVAESIEIPYSFKGPDESPESPEASSDSFVDAEEIVEDVEEAVGDADATLPVEPEIDDQKLQSDIASNKIAVPISWDPLNTIGENMENIRWDALDAGASVEQVDLLRIAYEQLSAAMSEIKGVDPGNAEDFSTAADNLKGAAQNFLTQLGLLSDAVPDLQVTPDFTEAVAAIADLALPDAEIKINPDTGEVESYVPADKSATVNFKPNFTAVTTAEVPRLRGIVEYTRQFVGPTEATGNAFAGGSAFKNGKGGLKHDVDALGGEVGPELVVRNGRYFTIGDNGAEFFRFKSGDIIFNASQTKELLKYGRVMSNGGRGKVLGDGSAYAEGFAFAGMSDKFLKGKLGVDIYGEMPKTKTSKSSGKKKTSSSSSKNKNKDKSSDKDKFDWIEVLIDRIEAKIDSLARKAESTFKVLATRTTALNEEIDKVGEEITIQQKAADRYFKEANKVKLSSKLKKQVQEGKIDITKYKGETLDKINEYKDW